MRRPGWADDTLDRAIVAVENDVLWSSRCGVSDMLGNVGSPCLKLVGFKPLLKRVALVTQLIPYFCVRQSKAVKIAIGLLDDVP